MESTNGNSDQPTATTAAVAPKEGNPVLGFLKSIFMGVGQCVLSGNWVTGLVIIAGIAYASWQLALWFLLGAGLATIVARLMKASKELIDVGLYGFAGGFGGVLTGSFVMANLPNVVPGELALLIILCSVMIVPIITTYLLIFMKLGTSSLALPIITLVWLVLAGFMHSGVVDHVPAAKEASEAAAAATPYTWQTVVYGILSAYGQVFGQGNPVTGGLILLGIAINSRIFAIMGVSAALIVSGIAIWLGFPESRIADGELLFNSILTAMALAGFLLYLDYRSVIYALCAAILAMFVYIASAAVLQYVHLPAMVMGFLVTTIFFAIAAQGLGFVTVVPLEKISIPEKCMLKDAPKPAEAE